MRKLRLINFIVVFSLELCFILSGCDGSGISTSNKNQSLSTQNTMSAAKSASATSSYGNEFLYVLDSGRAHYNFPWCGPFYCPGNIDIPEYQGSIYTYQINLLTGGLNLVGQVPVGVPGDDSYFMAISPNKANLYLPVRSESGSSIFRYSINQTNGVLTLEEQISFPDYPYKMLITADGNHAYVSPISGNTIYTYNIDQTGHLIPATQFMTQLHGATTSSGESITQAPDDAYYTFIIDSADTHLYVTDYIDSANTTNVKSIEVYNIQPDGSLVYAYNTVGGINSAGLTLSPNNGFLFSLGDHGINGWDGTNLNGGDKNNLLSYQTNNNLNYVSSQSGGNCPQVMIVTPDNNYSYELSWDCNGSVTSNSAAIGNGKFNLYQIGESGSLLPISNLNLPNSFAMDLAIDNSYQFLYILKYFGESGYPAISLYKIYANGKFVSWIQDIEIHGPRPILALRSFAQVTLPPVSGPILIDPLPDQLDYLPVDTTFTIQFPATVYTNSVTESTVQIVDSLGAIESCDFIWLNSVALQLIPHNTLKYHTNYTLDIAGVLNVDGSMESSLSVALNTSWGIQVLNLPESMHAGSIWTDTFMDTPVGQFGLKGYLIVNLGLLPIDNIGLIDINIPFGNPSVDEFWIDMNRSSCYNQLVANNYLNPQDSCSIVIRYQPQSYGENAILTFVVDGYDSQGNQQISESVNTSYSSRPQ